MEIFTPEEGMAYLRQGAQNVEAQVQDMVNRLRTASTDGGAEDASANPLLRAALANVVACVGKRIASAMLEFKTTCGFNLQHRTGVMPGTGAGETAELEEITFTLPFKELTDEERALPFLKAAAIHVPFSVFQEAATRGEKFVTPDDTALLYQVKEFMDPIPEDAYDEPQLMSTLAYMVGLVHCPLHMTPRPLKVQHHFEPYKRLQVLLYSRPTDDKPWIMTGLDLDIRRVFELTNRAANRPPLAYFQRFSSDSE